MLFPFFKVKPDIDEQQYRERPERGTSITEEWQRDSYHRHQAYCHAYVDEHVHEQTGGDAVAVYPGKTVFLLFGGIYQAYDQDEVKGKHGDCTQEAPLLADCAEDEICALLRHEVESGLCAVEITLSCQAARANGDE